MPNKDREQKVLDMMREVVKYDAELRKKYQIGEKFRFVRDRLHALLERLEQHASSVKVVKEEVKHDATAEEVIVYVYLYNAHGMNLASWQNFLTPKVFYEYSVNRPIYAEKKHVETLIRSKQNKVQHAFLTVAVKKDAIIQSATLQDSLGNSLLRVKEGALSFDRLLVFTHNDQEYRVNDEGELIKI